MHEVHFLTLAMVGGRRGWIAPVETPDETQQSAVYAVPLNPGTGLFDLYRLQFVKYLGEGQTISGASMLHLRSEGDLEVSIDGLNIRFRLRRNEGELVMHNYVGRLKHPDFQLLLAEIEPYCDSQLDTLYERDQIVLVGCDPATDYGTAGALH